MCFLFTSTGRQRNLTALSCLHSGLRCNSKVRARYSGCSARLARTLAMGRLRGTSIGVEEKREKKLKILYSSSRCRVHLQVASRTLGACHHHHRLNRWWIPLPSRQKSRTQSRLRWQPPPRLLLRVRQKPTIQTRIRRHRRLHNVQPRRR